jgi:hypothetical protein
MRLTSPHKDWRLDLVSVMDVKAVGLDQILTNLWLRVYYDNRKFRKPGIGVQRVVELAHEMERRGNDRFQDFADEPGVAEAWLRADLLRVFKRAPEEFSVARPLHSLAARVRNPRRDGDSNASSTVYGWLEYCGKHLLPSLKQFIDALPETDELDLASLGLALLGQDQEQDVAPDEPLRAPAPTCFGQATAYAEDLERLLAYRGQMPRSVLVEHAARLTGLHIGINYLRLFRIVVDIEQRQGETRACEACAAGRAPDGACPYQLQLFVDCGEDNRSSTARLAEDSWAIQEDYLGRYIRAHIALRKLKEVATERLGPRGRELPESTLEEVAAIARDARPERLDDVFGDRIADLLDKAKDDDEQRIQALVEEYRQLGLSKFHTYTAILGQLSERRWWNYHRELLDSLFLKNSSHGFLRQPLGGKRRRRAALAAGLLETLALIAVVVKTDQGFETRSIRVDQFLDWLERRYDFLIDKPPPDRSDDPAAFAVAADNSARFRRRLRETGLFVDLSDAFLAQTIRPRIHLRGES